MKNRIPTFRIPVLFLNIFIVLSNAGAGPVIDRLSTPQTDFAAEVVMDCTRQVTPIGNNRQATEWYAELIFNNDKHRPQISASQEEIEQWVNTASAPFVERYEVRMAWAPNSCSTQKICGKSILCPVGRDMYVGTDGVRQVEHTLEGDLNYFAIRNLFPGLPHISSELWAQPNGQILLWPLAWFQDSGLNLAEENTSDGQTVVRGSSSDEKALVADIYILSGTATPAAIQEIRYIYNRPNGGSVLVEGLMSNQKELNEGFCFPQEIIWTTRFLRVGDIPADLSKPIAFDPVTCSRYTYHVQSMKCGSVTELFPDGFLPSSPQGAWYIDTRYEHGDERRINSTLADYRKVLP